MKTIQEICLQIRIEKWNWSLAARIGNVVAVTDTMPPSGVVQWKGVLVLQYGEDF